MKQNIMIQEAKNRDDFRHPSDKPTAPGAPLCDHGNEWDMCDICKPAPSELPPPIGETLENLKRQSANLERMVEKDVEVWRRYDRANTLNEKLSHCRPTASVAGTQDHE